MAYKVKRRKTKYLWKFIIIILRLLLPIFSYSFFGQIFSFLTSVFYCRKEESYESPYLHCLEGLWIYSLTPAAIIAMVFQIMIGFITNSLYYIPLFDKRKMDYLKKNDSFPDIVFMFTKVIIILLFISDKGLEKEHWAMISFLTFVTGINAYFTFNYQNRHNKELNLLNNIFSLITFLGYGTLFIGKMFRQIEFDGLLYLFIFDIVIIFIFSIFYYKRKINFINIDYKNINNSNEFLKYIFNYYMIINDNNKRSSSILLKSLIIKLEEKCCDPDCPLKKYIELLYKGIEHKYFLLQYCDIIFKFGIAKFNDNIELKRNYLVFLIVDMNNKKKAKLILKSIQNKILSFQMNYNIFRCEELINNCRIKETNDNFNIIKYDNNFYELKKLITKVTLLRSEFLTLILGNKTQKVDNFQKIYSLGSKIKKMNFKIEDIYNELINAKANNIEIINLYSEFVEKILEDEEKYKECMKIKKLIFSNIENMSESSFMKYDIEFIKNKNICPYLVLSADLKSLGIIKDCSISFSKILSYQKNELIGKNINILIPEIFHKKHNIMLVEQSKKNKLKLYEDLSKNIISTEFLEIDTYAISKNKFLVPLNLNIYFIKNEENELIYIVEVFKKIPLINDEDNNELKCCVLTDENFLIQTFTSNSIFYLGLNYNHINANHEIINNIKQFQEDYLIDINTTHLSKNCSMKESSIITQKRMKKSLMSTSIVKSIKLEILNKNFSKKSKITWQIEEEDNLDKFKPKFLRKMSSQRDVFGTGFDLYENPEEKELNMEIKKIILQKEIIGYYFYFSKIIEKKKKLTKYDRDRHLSFKKTDIRKRIATSGKNLNKLHLTQKIDGPIFSEKAEIKRNKKRKGSLDKSGQKVKFEEVEYEKHCDVQDKKGDFVPKDYIPRNPYNFSFILHHNFYEISTKINNNKILIESLNKEVQTKIKKFQFAKNSLIYRKKNLSLSNYNSKTNSDSEDYLSSSHISQEDSSFLSNEEPTNLKKTRKSSKNIQIIKDQIINEENENEILEEEEEEINEKKNVYDYYKVNLDKIKLLKFDFYKEVFTEETDSNEKESKMELMLSNVNNIVKKYSMTEDKYLSFITGKNKNEILSPKKEENKIVLKENLINEEKILENKIKTAINKKSDETPIKRLKIISSIYFLIMIILYLVFYYYYTTSYEIIKGILNLVKNTIKMKYCDRMSVFYVGESTLLNFNADKIKGGIFSNFPGNINNKKGYIDLMREKIKEGFYENEIALQGLLSSKIKLTKNTTKYLTETVLYTDYILNDGSIQILKGDIFNTLMQYNGAFYNLATSPYDLEQNHTDILNFLHNSFNDYARGMNILIELYFHELETQAKYIKLIFIIIIVIFLIVYITIYILVIYYFIATSRKRASYIGVLYGIEERVLKGFIINCDNFYKKMLKSEMKMMNEEEGQEEDLKDSLEDNKSYIKKQKVKRKSIFITKERRGKYDEIKIKSKLPDNIFGFMKNFGILLLMTFAFYIFNTVYFINLEEKAILISKYFYKVQDFHSKMIDIFIAFRQYIFDDSIIIYNMLPFDYLEQTEKESYETLSDDVEFINKFIQEYLSDDHEVHAMLEKNYCSYNFTDKFHSLEECQKTIGEILNYDFSLIASYFIEELRINKFLVKYLLSTGTIRGGLNDYDQDLWLKDPTIPKIWENYTGEYTFRLDLYNNDTTHAHLDLVFVNIILPYIEINRKYILPNLSIDNKEIYLYLTSAFYGLILFIIFFVFLLLKIRFINKHIYKTKNMLTLIPINILSSQKHMKQLLNCLEEN